MAARVCSIWVSTSVTSRYVGSNFCSSSVRFNSRFNNVNFSCPINCGLSDNRASVVVREGTVPACASRTCLRCSVSAIAAFFFFNDPPTTEIYTLSLHDALPIFAVPQLLHRVPKIGPEDHLGRVDRRRRLGKAKLDGCEFNHGEPAPGQGAARRAAGGHP